MGPRASAGAVTSLPAPPSRAEGGGMTVSVLAVEQALNSERVPPQLTVTPQRKGVPHHTSRRYQHKHGVLFKPMWCFFLDGLRKNP